MRYFRLFDDMSTDQRWYMDNPEGPGGEWLGDALNSCRRYDGQAPLTVQIHHPGPPLEFTMALNAVPIINERVAEIFRAHIGEDAQLIPTRVTESDAQLWAVNVLAEADCFDEARTAAFKRYTAEDGRPELIGDYYLVGGLRIDPARTGGHAIFRIRGDWPPVIVNESLAEALQKANVRCDLKLVS